jgi:tight adherence protein C
MQFLNDLFSEQMGSMGLLIALGGLGLILILGVLPLMLNQREDPMAKLQRTAKQGQATKKSKKDQLRQESGVSAHLDKFAGYLEPKDEGEFSAMQLTLRQAGYHSADSVRVFHFAQMALGVLGLALGYVYVSVIDPEISEDMTTMIMYIMIPGGSGYYLPKYWVTRRVEERKIEITRGFPDSLDMLLVCVEAGQSLEQSIVRVAAELNASFPDLAEEFQVVAHELKAGKEKERVLRDFSARCGVPDISAFVTVLIQSAKFGTSIAEALRIYSAEMRDKRVMRAEEAANKLPTKMTLATMMLTIPPLLVILVGPSMNNLSNFG